MAPPASPSAPISDLPPTNPRIAWRPGRRQTLLAAAIAAPLPRLSTEVSTAAGRFVSEKNGHSPTPPPSPLWPPSDTWPSLRPLIVVLRLRVDSNSDSILNGSGVFG